MPPSANVHTRQLTIAHRGGNTLLALRAAEAAAVDWVETDLWLRRGRVEVRHPHALGPFPLLREGWRLLPGWRLLALPELLHSAAPETALFLDLKGGDRRLGKALAELLDREAPCRRFGVCSQQWAHLEPFLARDGTWVCYSVGSERLLAALPQPLPHGAAVGIDHRLLTPQRAEALRERATDLVTWTVNSVERARQLLVWGVTAITSDDLEVLAAVRALGEIGDTA